LTEIGHHQQPRTVDPMNGIEFRNRLNSKAVSSKNQQQESADKRSCAGDAKPRRTSDLKDPSISISTGSQFLQDDPAFADARHGSPIKIPADASAASKYK